MFVFVFAKKMTRISLGIVLAPGPSGNTKLAYFVVATSRTNSVRFDFLQHVAATKSVLQRQRFSEKFSSTHEAICRCDMLLQPAA